MSLNRILMKYLGCARACAHNVDDIDFRWRAL